MHCAFSKEVNAKYETYVLNVGDFDERIFLGDDSTVEIGTPAKGTLAAAYESSERLQITRNLLQNYQDVSNVGTSFYIFAMSLCMYHIWYLYTACVPRNVQYSYAILSENT